MHKEMLWQHETDVSAQRTWTKVRRDSKSKETLVHDNARSRAAEVVRSSLYGRVILYPLFLSDSLRWTITSSDNWQMICIFDNDRSLRNGFQLSSETE